MLQWVKDGCPQGAYEHGQEHRIVARALANRGLVTISGRGSTWRARITPAGITRVEAAAAAGSPPSDSEADQLIARVLDAGGSLVLPQDRNVEQLHERLVTISMKSPRRPPGKKLAIRRTRKWSAGPSEIYLAEHFDDFVDARPVPVPTRVGVFHPAVRAFLDDTDWQYVTKAHLPRAARLLQAIAAESSKRGIAVRKGDRTGRTRCHLLLETRAGTYKVQAREIAGPGARQVTPRQWNERKTRPSWIENRGWEFITTGRLELVVHGPGTSHQGDHYRDARNTTIEMKLPQLFRSFEIHRLRAESEQQQRRRADAELRQQHETALARAKVHNARQVRWEHHKKVSLDWQMARGHREFAAAMRAAIETLELPNRAEILAQLEAAEQMLDEIDATRHPDLLLPDIPEPGRDDLAPYIEDNSLLDHGR